MNLAYLAKVCCRADWTRRIGSGGTWGEAAGEMLGSVLAREGGSLQPEGMWQKICSVPGRKQELLCVYVSVCVCLGNGCSSGREHVAHILCQEVISTFSWSSKMEFLCEVLEPSLLEQYNWLTADWEWSLPMRVGQPSVSFPLWVLPASWRSTS